MKLFVLNMFVFLCVTVSSSAIISSGGLQRIIRGYSCIFRWKVNETIDSYSIFNQTIGSQAPLGANANVTTDQVKGLVNLTITSVQLSDAGNYSLVVTTATGTYVDSTACLFVYVDLRGSVKLTGDSQTATEGDTLVFNCLLTSVSLPAAYRPTVYYSWYVWQHGYFRNISSGPAINSDGDVVPGYTIMDDGRTFVVHSFQHPNAQSVGCVGLEDGSSFGRSLFFAQFTMRYRPYVNGWNPPNKKFPAVVGSSVSLNYNYQANPITSVNSYWTFINTDGVSKELPPNVTTWPIHNSVCNGISFNFISTEYYGNYSVTLTNAVGSTTVTFQVVKPGPPDAPSSLRVFVVSHVIIFVNWNLMWSNVIPPEQTVFTRLALSDGNVEIETSNSSFDSEDFNSTSGTYFGNKFQPETNYIVSVWSSNAFGPSEVFQLLVRTRKQPKLIVLPEMITFNGSQAIVNFTVELDETMENITRVDAECCSELYGLCVSSFKKYSKHYPDVANGLLKDQIVVDNIPNGTDYYVEVTISSGSYGYYSDMVKGIRVSRTADPTLPVSTRRH